MRELWRGYTRLRSCGELDGVRLTRPSSIEAMITEQHNITELMQDRPYISARHTAEYAEAVYMGPNPRAFGHLASGLHRFADPTLTWASLTRKQDALGGHQWSAGGRGSSTRCTGSVKEEEHSCYGR